MILTYLLISSLIVGTVICIYRICIMKKDDDLTSVPSLITPEEAIERRLLDFED